MRTAELHVGQEVFVRLPHEGGRGWARIVDLDVSPERYFRSRTILVEFLPGEGRGWSPAVKVAAASIVRTREGA